MVIGDMEEHGARPDAATPGSGKHPRRLQPMWWQPTPSDAAISAAVEQQLCRAVAGVITRKTSLLASPAWVAHR